MLFRPEMWAALSFSNPSVSKISPAMQLSLNGEPRPFHRGGDDECCGEYATALGAQLSSVQSSRS